MMLEPTVEILNRVLEPHCRFAYLLGSVGTPRFTPASDIDVAAFFNSPPTLTELAGWISELENELHRDVDLVALNDIDSIFARQVMETGRILFCLDAGELLNWKAKQLSFYADFKKSREIIEKSLLNRKKYV
jgi:predicted nucleotidyltransferase